MPSTLHQRFVALLCETCGYGLAGLPETSDCPECGTPIARSLPTQRAGSRWLRRPGLFSWARTNWDVVRHPKTTFRSLQLVGTGWRPFLAINLLIAAFLLVEPYTGTFIGDPLRNARAFDNPAAVAGYAFAIISRTAGAALLLFGLTWIETLGVRFFAARRGWRITKAAAWQICAHASIGWVLMALLPLLVLALYFSINLFFGSEISRWTGRSVDLRPVIGISSTVGEVGVVGLTLVAYAAGLVVFESLVYVGVRKCRYGNAPT